MWHRGPLNPFHHVYTAQPQSTCDHLPHMQNDTQRRHGNRDDPVIKDILTSSVDVWRGAVSRGCCGSRQTHQWQCVGGQASLGIVLRLSLVLSSGSLEDLFWEWSKNSTTTSVQTSMVSGDNDTMRLNHQGLGAAGGKTGRANIFSSIGLPWLGLFFGLSISFKVGVRSGFRVGSGGSLAWFLFG